MSVQPQLDQELKRLTGFNGPASSYVSLKATGGETLTIEFVAVDSMSASIRELKVQVPQLQGAGFDKLEEWAAALTQRISYLLEGLGVIELDPSHDEVQIRSTPPDQQGQQTQYYEIMLTKDAAGHFSLRRYWTDKSTAGRLPVDIQLTHEQLRKLCRDVLQTIPSP
ncbi:hypothetical protein [Calycomorphotria hydatis]|uniref:Uncharacterized protein n=1 Tax=Calycomorphotria hydatis TaxID=2528027 RepID=A0A517T402_9PLAN|nr:hypothetical protein [Calycomorphotria hydatis]QDT63081.1 hypothetical protein V22_02810 [Calycomorphotria hydatis]